MRVLFVCLVVVLGLVTVGTDASEATSPSWRLASGGIDGGGHEASSPSWSLTRVARSLSFCCSDDGRGRW